MGIRINERALKVQRAKSEIQLQLIRLVQEHELTDIEYLQILSEAQLSTLKYMLRSERHPDDPDQPADWE